MASTEKTTLELRREDLYRALHEAAEHTDGKITQLAEYLGCSTQWLYKQVQRGEFHWEVAKRIEVLTKGQVTRERLNPRAFL